MSSKSTVDAKDMFTGKANGLPFEKFDEKVISWGRKKYGERYAKALWRNELVEIKDLNLDDDLDKYKFDEHCSLVNDVIACESPKYAASLLADKRFGTLKWQVDCRYRFREKLFCHLETMCTEEAGRQLQKRGVSQMTTMREFFFRRFGASQPELVKEREEVYLTGMPNANGEVFPPRCNMVDKLNALEKEREFLLDMCPKDKQDTYDAGKETTLVRILLKTLPKEYDAAIKEVKALLRFRKVSSMGMLDSISNLEDNVRMNYSEDWLPEYAELRHALLNEYYLHERRRKEEGKHHKGGHPVLPILQGHEQPGPEQRPCYGCGQRGDHLRGDPKCPAGPNGIWEGAPQIFKDRVQKRGPKGGKGKGNGRQRNLGNRKPGEAAKTPCPNWSRGNGYCKFGPNCRNSHAGPKGGKPEFKKRKNEVVFMATKKGKKARKQLSTMVIKDIKETFEKGAGQSNSKAEESEDSHLYQLIRGVPTVMISRGENEQGPNYRPLKPKSISSVEEREEERAQVLPRTWQEYVKDKDKYANNPAWDLCSPIEFYSWTRDWEWTEERGHQPMPGCDFYCWTNDWEWKGDKEERHPVTAKGQAGRKMSRLPKAHRRPVNQISGPVNQMSEPVNQMFKPVNQISERREWSGMKDRSRRGGDRVMGPIYDGPDAWTRRFEAIRKPEQQTSEKPTYDCLCTPEEYYEGTAAKAWKRDSPVDFIVTLMVTSEETDESSDEDPTAKGASSAEESSSDDDSESSGSTESGEIDDKEDNLTTSNKTGQSSITKNPEPVRKPMGSKKTIFRSKGNQTVNSSLSNPEKTISGKVVVLESDDDAGSEDEEKILDEEKVSHLKEQLFTWKYRTSCAEERVARLLMEKERSIKASNEKRRMSDPHYSDVAAKPFTNRGGARARLSDTLDLLTEPKWEADPDPNVDWIVLKIPRGNKTFFMADFVDGDVEDEKEWLEGPYQQSATVEYLMELKRKGRKERRRKSIYLRSNKGKTITKVKHLQRPPAEPSSMESRARSIAPNTSNWRNLATIWNETSSSIPSPIVQARPPAGYRSVEVEGIFSGERKRLRAEMSAEGSSAEELVDLVSPPLSKERWELFKECWENRDVDRKDLFNAQDLLQYERQYYTQEYEQRPLHKDYVTPRFKHGANVTFCDNEARVSGSGIVTRVIKPGEKGNAYRTLNGALDPNIEVLYEIDTVASTTPGYKGWVRESHMWKSKGKGKPVTALPVSRTKALHPLDHVGIDTCSAVSVSTEIADFVFLDQSVEARNSLSLNGVGNGGPVILGRGPMVISTLDDHGDQVFVLDPAGVYVKGSDTQARMRILGQQRMNKFGFNHVQDYASRSDNLIYRDRITIPLTEKNGILMVRSVPWELNKREMDTLTSIVSTDGEPAHYCFQVKPEEGDAYPTMDLNLCPSLIINEATLSKEERERLDHWRNAHRSSSGKRHKERCHTCEQAKHKSVYKPNDYFKGTTTSTNRPYFRLYADGYGGQKSMGAESYQGGIGGFVFVCPVSGKIKAKLYSTLEQFPAVLYQVLQEIESEGYACRELYVDTHAVNISAAAEEVAGMFRIRIIPISGGTPQELAYAESAVRTLGQMSRAQMLGAPHLPQMMWGLSDLHAAWVHNALPQKTKQGKTPHEMTTGREPDRDLLFLHVFGCPCQYEPANAVEHKRSAKTEWGWFVGLQWPMVLILRPFDNKVISISRKKVHCHEEMYAKFDAEHQTRPRIEFKDFTLDRDEIDDAIRKGRETRPTLTEETKHDIPDHVLSVKVLSDFRRNQELNTPAIQGIPSAIRRDFNSPQPDPGENCEVPEPVRLTRDLLLEEIEKFKKRLGERNLTDRIVRALKIVEDETSNLAPGRNSLRRKKKDTPGASLGKRERAKVTISQNVQITDTKRSRLLKVKIVVPTLKIDDRVKIRTFRFGKEYARGRPKYTYGNIVSLDGGKVIDVKWDNEEGEGEIMKTKLADLQLVDPVPAIVGQILKETRKCGWPFRTVEAMFPVLEVGSQLSVPDINANGNWPRDFIEALIRPDWRLWVEAVKSENDSWDVFEATIEIPYRDVKKGASVIPLGELFTIKRSGKYKFRQIALGNLLKEGKDYGETFATTVSGDGLRWFCSLAVTCGKEIKGWDATTGYLQTEQRVPVYAYLPSHHGFSCLEYEELAKFRTQLITVLEKEGMKGIKEFSKRLRQERRIRPETVLELKRSVYGIPDAGQSFSMFMQSLHIKKCNMVQSDMDPCLFYKIYECDNNELGHNGTVTDFLIAITWVDDCRYFGTERLVRDYERTISEHCKCTLEGRSTEFVSIKIDHNIEKGTLELTQTDYWEKAVERFKEFLPQTGPKERLVPLSPSDERLLVEPTEAEIKAGEHLPFPNVLGVVQYPSNFTKMEMRYAMSVLSRHRTKWGLVHFKILLKSLEYGWTSRAMGVKYNSNLDPKFRNVLVAYADSSFSTPRSQGCRMVMMNGGAISFTSKRHTTTDDSTTAAELTEAYLCACDVEGFRNINEEIGLRAEGPTILYQDNQSAIQIAMNRGSLSKKTRAMDVRVLAVRNKIEDMKVVPIYLETENMLADIGTKALDPKAFVSLRDKAFGYVMSFFR